MNDPNFLSLLQGIDYPEGASPKRQGNLQHSRSHVVYGFCDISLAALSGDGQGGKANRPRPFRESFEFFQCRLDPGNGPCFSGHPLALTSGHFCMLSYMTTYKSDLRLTPADDQKNTARFLDQGGTERIRNFPGRGAVDLPCRLDHRR